MKITIPEINDSDTAFAGSAGPSMADLAQLETEEVKPLQDNQEEIPTTKDFIVGSFYKRMMEEHPVLTHEQVCELYVRIKAGDASAREKMVLHNIRFVIKQARRYSLSNEMLHWDLVQEGTMGLMTAVDRFEPSRGFHFSTYAIWWIRQRIQRYFENNRTQIRLPTHIHETRNRIKKVANELQNTLGRRPSIAEIAEKAECGAEKVTEAFEGVGNIAFSFNQEVSMSDGDVGSTYGERVADSRPGPDEIAMAHESIDDLATRINILLKILDTVPVRQAGMFRTFYGLTSDSVRLHNTLESVAYEIKVSRERVRQVKKLVWERVHFRAPHIGLNNDVLVELRRDTGLFVQIWERAEELRREQPVHQELIKTPAPIRLSKAFLRKDKPLHIRASPSFVKWQPSSASTKCGEHIIDFVSKSYEVSPNNMLGYGRQDDESRFARRVCGFFAQSLGYNVKSAAVGFNKPYIADFMGGSAFVKNTMAHDAKIRDDIEGMLAHFKTACRVKK